MRKHLLLLCCVIVGLASACSSSESASMSETERINAMITDGTEQEVAECVAQIESQALLQNESITEARTKGVARQELLASCEELYGIVSESETTREQNPSDTANVEESDANYGDDRALDVLWDKCEQGSGEDCNTLFDEAPLGSGYEQYGVSCGNREGVLRCEELGSESDPVPRIAAEAEKAAAK